MRTKLGELLVVSASQARKVQQDILGYIVTFYNGRKRHSMLGYTDSNDYESVVAELSRLRFLN